MRLQFTFQRLLDMQISMANDVLQIDRNLETMRRPSTKKFVFGLHRTWQALKHICSHDVDIPLP